jgi:predicted acyl esterase
MSRGTSEAFFDAVEWAADQGWSSGKVGLLGISYYAGSQWRVAALQPRGLSAIIPWVRLSPVLDGDGMPLISSTEADRLLSTGRDE